MNQRKAALLETLADGKAWLSSKLKLTGITNCEDNEGGETDDLEDIIEQGRRAYHYAHLGPFSTIWNH